MQETLKNGANDITEIVNMVNVYFLFCYLFCYFFFVKKLKILCSSDHPILFKLYHFVVNIVSKELLIVFWISTVNNSNGNITDLDRKNPCEKMMFRHVPIGNFLLPL